MGFHPTCNGLITTPRSMAGSYFTDRFLFGFRSDTELKQKDAIEAVIFETAIDSDIVFDGTRAALLLEFKINSPHYTTYARRLRQLSIEYGASYVSGIADEKVPFSIAKAREGLERKAYIQKVCTQEKAKIYLQSLPGMYLGIMLALHLGLLSPSSIELCVNVIREKETKATLSKKKIEDGCVSLKNYGGFWKIFRNPSQQKAVELRKRLKEMSLTPERWNELIQILKDNLRPADPAAYREAVMNLQPIDILKPTKP